MLGCFLTVCVLLGRFLTVCVLLGCFLTLCVLLGRLFNSLCFVEMFFNSLCFAGMFFNSLCFVGMLSNSLCFVGMVLNSLYSVGMFYKSLCFVGMFFQFVFGWDAFSVCVWLGCFFIFLRKYKSNFFYFQIVVILYKAGIKLRSVKATSRSTFVLSICYLGILHYDLVLLYHLTTQRLCHLRLTS